MARKQFTKNDFRRALRKVRTKLLNGKITKEQFDMDTVLFAGDDPKAPMCGTFGCIGGHMAIELEPEVVARQRSRQGLFFRVISGRDAHDLMREAVELIPEAYALFYNYDGHSPHPRRVTRVMAAAAITRMLEGSPDPWKSRRR